jgi:hypothetical protein
MNNEYVERVVKILDAEVKQDLGDNENPKFKQSLVLLLQDIENNEVFKTILQEEDIRKIVRINSPLTSKQLIDLCILLRQREEPLRLMVPQSSFEISADDILKNTQPPKKNRRRKRNSRNRKKIYQSNDNNRKIN